MIEFKAGICNWNWMQTNEKSGEWFVDDNYFMLPNYNSFVVKDAVVAKELKKSPYSLKNMSISILIP